jgi:hypothetical protein
VKRSRLYSSRFNIQFDGGTLLRHKKGLMDADNILATEKLTTFQEGSFVTGQNLYSV